MSSYRASDHYPKKDEAEIPLSSVPESFCFCRSIKVTVVNCSDQEWHTIKFVICAEGWWEWTQLQTMLPDCSVKGWLSISPKRELEGMLFTALDQLTSATEKGAHAVCSAEGTYCQPRTITVNAAAPAGKFLQNIPKRRKWKKFKKGLFAYYKVKTQPEFLWRPKEWPPYPKSYFQNPWMSPYMAKGLCWCDSTKVLVVKRVLWKHPKALNRMTRVLIREKQWEKWRRQCSNQEAGLTEGRRKDMWRRCRALPTPYHRWLLPRSL